jgi:uncharacterized caspase-like protein
MMTDLPMSALPRLGLPFLRPPALIAVVLAAALLFLAQPALAERRVALVMAVEAYRDLRPLANPVNDAVAMQAVLEDLGFEVFLETNRDLRRMRRALEDFAEDAAGADVALVFFAGHGVEIGGRNLLLPVDAAGETPEALAASSLPLEEVVEVARAVAPTALIVLDACRDDPFGAPGSGDGRGASSLMRPAEGPAVRPGLGRMGRAEGVLFAFAAAPGETASDGTGGNSPFTEGLVQYLGAEGLEVRSALTLVQQEVYDRTRGRQLPYVESGLPRLFFAAQTAGELPERERLLLAMADITPDLRAEIEQVAAFRAMPLAPLFGAALSADLANVPPAQRAERLNEAANAFLKVQDDLRRFSSDDPRVQALRDEAERQLSLGAFATARARLTEAAEIDSESRGAVRETFVARTLSEAETHLLNASAARADLRLTLAIDDLRRATDLYAEVEGLGIDRRAMEQHTKALWDMGELHLSTGNTDAAMAAFERWTDVATARAEAEPDDPEWQRDMAASWSLTANVLLTQGDLAGAHAAYLASREIFVQLSKAHPETALWRRDVVATDVLLGDIASSRGNFEDAVRFHRSGRDGLAALIEEFPDNMDWRADGIAAKIRLGYSLLWGADLAGALDELDTAIAEARAIAERFPAETKWPAFVMSGQIARGTALSWAGDREAALAAISEAEELSRMLIARDPDNTEWTRDRTTVLLTKGDLLAPVNQAAALETFAEGLEIARALAAQDVGNTALRRSVAMLLSRVGDLNARAGQRKAALAALDEAIAISGALAEIDAGNFVWRQDLALARRNKGDALRTLGDAAEAQRAYAEARATIEAILKGAPETTTALIDLSQTLERIGRLHLDAGAPVDAEAAWRVRLAAAERAAKTAPENATAHFEVVSALHALGTLSAKPRPFHERALGLVLTLEANGLTAEGANGWTEFLRAEIAALPE